MQKQQAGRAAQAAVCVEQFCTRSGGPRAFAPRSARVPAAERDMKEKGTGRTGVLSHETRRRSSLWAARGGNVVFVGYSEALGRLGCCGEGAGLGWETEDWTREEVAAWT